MVRKIQMAFLGVLVVILVLSMAVQGGRPPSFKDKMLAPPSDSQTEPIQEVVREEAFAGSVSKKTEDGLVAIAQRSAGITPHFSLIPVQPLEQGKLPEGWKEIKMLDFSNVSGRGKSQVKLYANREEKNPHEIKALFLTEGQAYHLGTVSSYGLKELTIEARDDTNDGVKELVVTGGLGSTYIETKIVGYSESRRQWVQYLASGSMNAIDLDRDSRKELVATSRGLVPSYVWIYRWNQDHFEYFDLAKATDNAYAKVLRRKTDKHGRVVLEAGKLEQSTPQYYIYAHDQLRSIKSSHISAEK